MSDGKLRFLTDGELSAWIGAGFVLGMGFMFLLRAVYDRWRRPPGDGPKVGGGMPYGFW